MTVPHVSNWELNVGLENPTWRWRARPRPVVDVEVPGVNDPLKRCQLCDDPYGAHLANVGHTRAPCCKFYRPSDPIGEYRGYVNQD